MFPLTKNPIWISVGAVVRRFALIAGAGLLAFALESWTGWIKTAFLADPATAVVWPVVYAILEFIQKLLRERIKWGV